VRPITQQFNDRLHALPKPAASLAAVFIWINVIENL
jgi:hypothetical protein